MEERLQKIISRAGIASRRAGEEIILAGRVRVNGRVVTELGMKADLGRDIIEVDGRRLVHETMRYLVLHKPRGVVSTLSDPEGRPTVAGLLEGAGARLYPVGRLDFATSGVLLVTNDGDFANGLLHPRGGVPKTYVCKAKGIMTQDDLDHWRNGMRLDDGPTLPADIHFLRHEEDKTWFEITLREGRNQQIRRMGEASGFPIMRLARLSFAGVTSEGLRPGQWRPLGLEELLAIREQFGVPKRVRAAAASGIPQEGGGRPRPARAPRREGREGSARPTRAHAGAAEARASRPERPTRSHAGAAEARASRPERPTRSHAGAAEARSSRPERPTRSHAGAAEARSSRPERPTRSHAGAAEARSSRPARSHAGTAEGRSPRAERPERQERADGPKPHGQGRPARSHAGAAEAQSSRPERAASPKPRGPAGPRSPRTSESPSPAPTRSRSAGTAPTGRPGGRKPR